MNFFDMPWQACPQNARFYFNILVIVILVPHESLQEAFDGQPYIGYWNIESVNEPRPYVVGLVGMSEEEMQEEMGDEVNFIVEMHPHCVVQVDPELGVNWYTMFGEETEDLWRL